MIPLAAFCITPVSAGPILGNSAGTFAILGGAGVAINGTGSLITGNVGGCCNATAVTGVIPTNFTISGGTVQMGGATATTAQTDLAAAITGLNGLSGSATSEPTLNGITLAPGVYSIGALTLTGTLTLDAQNNPSALWVFLESSTFMTAGGSTVAVINAGGSPNGIGVYWVMTTSANLGTTSGASTFAGNILANGAITVGTGVTTCGSLLTQVDSVTLAGNDAIGIGCAGGGTLNNGIITPTPSVPEPNTFLLVASCLAASAFLGVRSRSRLLEILPPLRRFV